MLGDVLAEDRRLVVLLLLTDAPGGSLNEDVLRLGLEHIGHLMDRTDTRAVLQFLSDHGLVRMETLALPRGELWLAHLTDAGQAVARGRSHPGVARPPLR
jgi:hypothetical protein